MNKVLKCRFCNRKFEGKFVTKKHLRQHQKSCYLNPKNKRHCKYCGSLLDSKRKFCDRSCSASFNNKGRKMSLESKRKTSKSLGGKGIAQEEWLCEVCGVPINRGAKACQKHKDTTASKLSWYFYEKKIRPKLEKKFGKLDKEIIAGTPFDFCNNKVVIEFTFSSYGGVGSVVKRFKKIKKDKRRKIAYIPDRNVGDIRRGRIEALGVEIRSSEKYRKYFSWNER